MATRLPATVKVFTDGCAKGNPGPAGAAYVIQDIHGETLDERAVDLGEATNNEAEYEALIAAMERCAAGKVKTGFFYTDSELMAHQINGIYRIKSPRLAKLAQRVETLKERFEGFHLAHVRRSLNRRADRLASRAIAEARRRETEREETRADVP